MNGFNERNHGVIDCTYEKIKFDNPGMNPEIALAWAVNAKNCLPMNNGFSSFQLVFGKNPNLLNIIHDFLPALEGVSTSKAVAEHITAMYAGRKAFAEVQCDEQTRRTFRHRVRAVEKVFSSGSNVYYKHDGQERWRGPATVIGNDGSVYFLRHQATLYRVSACRIIDREDIEEVEKTEICDNDKKKKNDSICKENSKKDDDACDDRDKHNSNTIIEEQQSVDIEPSVAVLETPAIDVTAGTDARKDKIRKKQYQKVGDKIEYKVGENEEVEWFEVEVFGKGKVGGRNEGYLNIHYADGSEGGIDIVKHQWRLKDSEDISGKEINTEENVPEENIEEALVVMIPWSQHNRPECQEAKNKEMHGWEENDTYDEVDDIGQKRISTMWILTTKIIDGKKG